MTNEERISLLARRIRGLPPSDRSVLDAVLQAPEPEVNLATTTGSANDQLWSQMAELGWMSLESPADLPAGSRMFKVGATGKAALARVFDDKLFEHMARDAMFALFNELRHLVPRQIAERAIAAGGTPADVAMMLAGIVEATMRRWIKPELHDEFLRAVTDRTQDLHKQFKGQASG